MTAAMTPPPAKPGSDRLLVFVRAPAMGKVKTRLARSLGFRQALQLHCAFAADVLATAATLAGPVRTCVCHQPPDAHPAMRRWLGDRFRLWPQQGRDLGERMIDAFRRSFAAGARRTVLVGTDVPDLPAWMIAAAFEGLDHRDAVMTPTVDGGYCLIGFRRKRFLEPAFRRMPWGGSDVGRQTLDVLRRHDRTVQLLPCWRDIDTADDLAAFLRSPPDGAGPARHTRACLATAGKRSRGTTGKSVAAPAAIQ